MSNEKLLSMEELVQCAGDLQMMPQVARKVIELVSNERTTADQLADLLQKDASITTRILKIANSAFYGLRREVKTIQQAIVILGFRSLRSLVVASSSKSLHKKFGITEQLMWSQSIGTAIAGKVVAGGLPVNVGELAFVGGLLHNVGQTVMNNHCPLHFSEVMQKVYNDGATSIEAEIDVFEYDHTEVGFLVTEKWGLPADLTTMIRFYPLSQLSPEKRAKIPHEQDLQKGIACIEVATQICQILGIGYREKISGIKIAEGEGLKRLGADSSKADEWIQKTQEAYEREKAIFN